MRQLKHESDKRAKIKSLFEFISNLPDSGKKHGQ